MLNSKPKVRPPLCGFLVCFVVSMLGVVCFVFGRERTSVVVMATIFLSGGVSASGLFLFCFFKTQRVYEKAESYVPKKFNIPEAKHLAMMSLDPLLRNPMTDLRYRCWCDHPSLESCEGKPPSSSSLSATAPRQKRILPSRNKLASFVMSSLEETAEPKVVVCSSSRRSKSQPLDSSCDTTKYYSHEERQLWFHCFHLCSFFIDNNCTAHLTDAFFHLTALCYFTAFRFLDSLKNFIIVFEETYLKRGLKSWANHIMLCLFLNMNKV